MKAIWFSGVSHLGDNLEQGVELCFSGYYGMTWDEAGDPTFDLAEALRRKLPRPWLFAVIGNEHREVLRQFQASSLWRICEWRMIFPLDSELSGVYCFVSNDMKQALDWAISCFRPELLVLGKKQSRLLVRTAGDWLKAIEKKQQPVLGSYAANINLQYFLKKY